MTSSGTGYIAIRPKVPPELGDNPKSFAVSGHPNCVKFLSRLGITEGLILTWTSPCSGELKTAPKSCAIFIPSLKGSSGVMVLKLISNLKSDKAVSNLADQISEQLLALDLFISSLKLQIINFIVQVLLIGTSPKIDEVFERRISLLKLILLQSLNQFKSIEVHVSHVLWKNENETLEDSQKQVFTSGFDKCITHTQNKFQQSANVIDALIESTPEFMSLKISENMYNCNNSENNEGFNLKNIQKVRETYLKFFKGTVEKILFLPDFDCPEGHLLDSTCENKGHIVLHKADGFLGEYVNFTECLLSRLREPKGLLIRRYSKVHLDAVLDEKCQHNFEFDWIFCSKTKIFAFEVGRTDNVMQPKTAIQRKIESVFCTTFPRFQFLLISLLKEMQMAPEDVRKFADEHFGFVIYFPNISKNSIVSFLAGETQDSENQINLLNSMPESIFSQVFVLTTEDENFYSSIPNLYKFVYNGSTWSLELASLTVTDLFQCEVTESSNVNINALQKKSSSKILPEIQYLSGLLSFGFLVKKFSHGEDSCLKSEAEKGAKSQTERKPHSDLILSPQQERILGDNKRFLLLAGEPGSGKTSLLLAKALDAAYDDEIEKIFFIIPGTKTKFKEWLQNFVSKSNCNALKSKWNLLEISELDVNMFSGSTVLKSILLVDEIYFTSSHEMSKNDVTIVNQCRLIEIMPSLKQCWLAHTEAGQRDKSCFTNFSQAMLPLFEIEVLNVLFRSSWHIGSFSTKLLHQMKNISVASAQTFGCTGASQYKVERDTFLESSDLIDKMKSCATLNPKFNSDRIAIVFTTAESEQSWSSSLLELSDIVTQVFVIIEDMSLRDLPFTGVEVASVVVIIDFVKKNSDETSKFLSLVLLAASRAQFELHLMIKEVYARQMETLSEVCNNQIEDPTVLAARMGWPLELDKIFDKELSSQQFVRRGNELLAIAVLTDDCKLFKAVAKSFPPQKVDLGRILCTFLKPKTKELLKAFKKYLGPVLSKACLISTKVPSILLSGRDAKRPTSLLNCFIRFFVKQNLKMLEDSIGVRCFEALIRQSGQILFSACMNGNFHAIEWAVNVLEKYGILEKELNEIYDIWEGKRSTLLLFLCYVNMRDADAISLLRKKGFHQNLLSFKLDGRNALEFSIYYRNFKAVKVLLENPIWVREFLPTNSHLACSLDSLGREPEEVELWDYVKSKFRFAWET